MSEKVNVVVDMSADVAARLLRCKIRGLQWMHCVYPHGRQTDEQQNMNYRHLALVHILYLGDTEDFDDTGEL